MTDVRKILAASGEMQRRFAALRVRMPPTVAVPRLLGPLASMPKVVAPAFAVQQQLRPFLELQDQWKGLVFKTPPWASAFRIAALDITRSISPLIEHYGKTMRPFAPIFQAVARTSTECQAIEDAGWLPHYTTPFDALADLEPHAFDEVIGTHYESRWPEVKSAFLLRLTASPLDDEAKAAFVDALTAHEIGMYRSTSRILFPEIERVARKEFHGLAKGQTSQRALRQAAEHLGLSDVEPGGMYAFRLFEKLFDHLYARTETPDELAVVALDPVPNRHAALHGFLPYDTAKNSINMLVMADFLFQVICALKAQQKVLDAPLMGDEAPALAP